MIKVLRHFRKSNYSVPIFRRNFAEAVGDVQNVAAIPLDELR